MKSAERNYQYAERMIAARQRWLYAEEAFEEGDNARAYRNMQWMYLELLLAAEVNWTSSTPRQVEQRKLAMQLRQLTGVIGNLKNLRPGDARDPLYHRISDAVYYLNMAEEDLRQQMKTIKERIPSETH